jgi:uncharacterized membrane protein
MSNLKRSFTSISAEFNLAKRAILSWIKDRYSLIVITMIFCYGLTFSCYSLLNHASFRTYGWDLGIYSQSLWTAAKQQRLFYYTIENPDGISLFAVHSCPILFLLVPVYAIYPYPETLLVLQSFVLALGALPLYWLARDELHNRTAGVLISASYLLYPALQGVNRFDFHVQALLPAFFLFAFYYYRHKSWKRYFLFLVLALSCIEFVPFIVISFAIYQFLPTAGAIIRKKMTIKVAKEELLCAAATLILGLAFLLVDAWILATFNPSQPLVSRLSQTRISGNSLPEIFINSFTHPEETLRAFFADWPNKFSYLLYLFAPLTFAALFDPLSLLLVVPWIGAASITTWSAYYSIYYQYSGFVIPFLFISTVNGIRRFSGSSLKAANGFAKKFAVGVLVCTLLFGSYLSILSPINPFNGNPNNPFASEWWPEITRHDCFLDEAISLIPSNCSVLTQNEIIPHLCDRLGVFEYLTNTSSKPDFILLDPSLESYPSGFVGPFPGASFVATNLMKEEDYGLYASVDGALLYKRGYEEPPKFFVPQMAVFNYDQLIVSTGEVVRDDTSTFGKVIVSNSTRSVGTVWFGPYKRFAPGRYVATFRLKTENETCQLQLNIVSDSGTSLIDSRTINGSDFGQEGSWQDFLMYFEIDNVRELEFRGSCLTSNTQVALDFVRVEQVAP